MAVISSVKGQKRYIIGIKVATLLFIRLIDLFIREIENEIVLLMALKFINKLFIFINNSSLNF